MKKHLMPIAIGMVALTVAMLFRALDPKPIEALRLIVFDTYQRMAPRQDEDLPVRIVDIDDVSLARHGQWPWPRTLLATLVDRLVAEGAASIGFAMIFPEPDRSSPVHAVEAWPRDLLSPAFLETARSLPDHDAAFARAISGAPVVLGLSATATADGPAPAFSGGLAFAGSDPAPFLPRFAGGLTSLPAIDAAAWGRGSLLLPKDVDGSVRRVPLLVQIGDEVLPSFSAEALRAAQNASTIVTRTADASGGRTFGTRPGLTDIRIGGFTVPTTATGEFWLHYAPPRSDQTIPAWRLLEPGPRDPSLATLLAGQVVLIGTSAAGLGDYHRTPLDPAAPGVAIHAEALEQMISGSFLRRPDWADGAEILSLAAVGLPLILLMPLVGALPAAILGGLMAAGAVAGSWLAFVEGGLLLDPLYPTLAVLLIYLMVSLLVYRRTERERGQVRAAFGRYLSPQLVERLADDPRLLRLGGEKRELTLLFTDIRGFTGIAEGMAPEALTRFINRFLTPMTGIIMDHGGTIDKYMGDAIMAFWNAPLDDPDHARNAALAALAMRARLTELNAEWADEAERRGAKAVPIRIGIGLNTGDGVVGNVGSDQRFDYSVLGDAVNLASRLEGLTKSYGLETVVGERTRELAADLAFVEIDLIRVRGRSAPARVYALLGDAGLAASGDFRTLVEAQDDMLRAFRQRDWQAASAALEQARDADPEGRLAELHDLYGRRIAELDRMAPPDGWDGVADG